jgi:hypothetical protein
LRARQTIATLSVVRELSIMQTTTTEKLSRQPDLIPLKAAASALDLTSEGLRQRLLRLEKGLRQGGRWYVAASDIEQMRFASAVLGRK